MMKRVITYVLVGFGTIVGALVVYFLFFFELFPVHEELLETAQIEGQPYHVEVYYVDTGASSANTIQVRKVFDSGESTVVHNFESYTELKGIAILPGPMIQLRVGHSGRFSTQVDTVSVLLE